MLLRNRIARGIAAGALVLAVPTLAGCSFATDAVYTPAPGANNRDGDVDILAASIVASDDNGKGTLIATLSNNVVPSAADPIEFGDDVLTGIGGDVDAQVDGAGLKVAAGNMLAINEAGAQLAAAADGPARAAGIPVTGDFKLGDFVDVTFSFKNAGDIKIQVPVVCNTNHFAGEDTANAGAEIAEQCKTLDYRTHYEPIEGGH